MWRSEQKCVPSILVASDEYAITVVDQKFMTVGHSYLPNDRDFGSIETERCKHNTVFVPEEWYEFIVNARRKKSFHCDEYDSG